MAELNLKQIIDRLNIEFTGDTRKLVFWYDDNGEFAEDMKDIELENARVYYLEQDNQFYTKYFLERVDTTTNYLIYAPFPKPDVRENHLEDTLLYSVNFANSKEFPSSHFFHKKISTHLLTVLTTSVIVQIEQRKRKKKRTEPEFRRVKQQQVRKNLPDKWSK